MTRGLGRKQECKGCFDREGEKIDLLEQRGEKCGKTKGRQKVAGQTNELSVEGDVLVLCCQTALTSSNRQQRLGWIQATLQSPDSKAALLSKSGASFRKHCVGGIPTVSVRHKVLKILRAKGEMKPSSPFTSTF